MIIVSTAAPGGCDFPKLAQGSRLRILAYSLRHHEPLASGPSSLDADGQTLAALCLTLDLLALKENFERGLELGWHHKEVGVRRHDMAAIQLNSQVAG